MIDNMIVIYYPYIPYPTIPIPCQTNRNNISRDKLFWIKSREYQIIIIY